jgi:hypothetical protein
MMGGEIRKFSIPKEFGVWVKGSYKVDFSVYSRDMLPLARLSRKFTVLDVSSVTQKTKQPEQEKKQAAAVTISPTPAQTGDRRLLGIGAAVNTSSMSGGATMSLWPFRNVGLQGSYLTGRFTIIEGRVLARYPIAASFSPYIGVGYLSVSREVDVIGVRTRFEDKRVSGAVGIEAQLMKGLYGYVELVGASIDLKKEVTNGLQTAEATVKYSPVTLGMGLVYYLF